MTGPVPGDVPADVPGDLPSRDDDTALLTFAEVMRRLRVECPWKREQTHRSLSRYLLEEAYETLEAIDAGDRTGDWSHLREELGDLLLQVYFHAVVGEESGAFTLGDVAGDVTAKMRRRNPHVFSDAPHDHAGLDAAAVNELWQQEKAREKADGKKDGTASGIAAVLDGIPAGLPALLLADKVLDRLDRLDRLEGASPPPAGRPTERAAERAERMTSEEVGEELLALVAQARAAGVDPEQALRDAVRRRVAPGLG